MRTRAMPRVPVTRRAALSLAAAPLAAPALAQAPWPAGQLRFVIIFPAWRLHRPAQPHLERPHAGTTLHVAREIRASGAVVE